MLATAFVSPWHGCGRCQRPDEGLANRSFILQQYHRSAPDWDWAPRGDIARTPNTLHDGLEDKDMSACSGCKVADSEFDRHMLQTKRTFVTRQILLHLRHHLHRPDPVTDHRSRRKGLHRNSRSFHRLDCSPTLH